MSAIRILAVHDGHNGSVAFLQDGTIEVLVQEERFTYVKNQGGIPIEAINSIRDEYGDRFDSIIFSSRYMGTVDWSREAHLLEMHSRSTWRKSLRQRLKAFRIVRRMYRTRRIRGRNQRIDAVFPNRGIRFIDHHFCHAASAYFGRGERDKRILVITCDGDGDDRSGSAYIGSGGNLEAITSIDQKDSLGALYSYFTHLYCMVPLEHEYKIMGLAPYCNDRARIELAKRDLKRLIDFRDDRALTWNYVGQHSSIQAAGRELRAIFARHRFDVMAAGLQEFTEDLLVEWVARLVRHTGVRDLACAGGVFMNVKANMRIAQCPDIASIYVLPSCGDDTLPIGAAYHEYFQATGKFPQPIGSMYLGDSVKVEESELADLSAAGIQVLKPPDIEHDVASLLASGEVVGRVRGRMESGARALGNRSILANPSVDGVRQLINDMIKGRDFWMPFAPSVMAEDFDSYFYRDRAVQNYEHMVFTVNSRESKRKYAYHALHPYDFTARPHLVSAVDNPEYHRLLSKYRELTGEGLILNTSYNLHGYPIVRTARQAIDVFRKSGLKHLSIGDVRLSKA